MTNVLFRTSTTEIGRAATNALHLRPGHSRRQENSVRLLCLTGTTCPSPRTKHQDRRPDKSRLCVHSRCLSIEDDGTCYVL
jgi:hypothetical protein